VLVCILSRNEFLDMRVGCLSKAGQAIRQAGGVDVRVI